MVEENILRLQIRKLRDHLSNKADNVLSLEKQRLQLETVRAKPMNAGGDCVGDGGKRTINHQVQLQRSSDIPRKS